MTCKHEWRFHTKGESEDEWFYCIHCLAQAKSNREGTIIYENYSIKPKNQLKEKEGEKK
jgi:hypothetical protein